MRQSLPFTIACLLSIVLWFDSAIAQKLYSSHFNINNGLPSNLIYGSLVDRHGYFWFGTERGIVKYNGYEFKIFTTDNGLPTSDNFNLFEDKSGKIWLGNKANELGYIWNDKYYKVLIDETTKPVYAKNFKQSGTGVLFTSNFRMADTQASFVFSNGERLSVHNFGAAIKNVDNSRTNQKSVRFHVESAMEPCILDSDNIL